MSDGRAMSVQNPMSINDLMSRQPAPQRRMNSVPPPNLPPSGIRFSDARPAGPSDRSSSRGPPPAPAPSTSGDNTIGAEDEFGYELILNKNKVKKDDFGNSGGSRPEDDELFPDDNFGGGGDTFVDSRERAVFEQTGNSGPSLPPFRELSNARPPSVQRVAPVFQPQPSVFRGGWDETPKMSYEEMIERRKKVVEDLDKYRRRGLDVRAFSHDAPLEEMEAERDRHKRACDVESSIQFSRKMLMACVTGLEYINGRWNPLHLQLDGWSESVIEDIHNYDEVFERLYDKYHSTSQMAPEFELFLMVAGSAFMFHLTNSMFKSAMPGMANPDAMKSVRRGVMGAMSGALSGASNGGGIAGMMGGMFGGGGGGQRTAPPQRTGGGGGGGGIRNGPGAPMNPRRSGQTPPRREMRGPSGNIDEMLNNLMDREPGEISNRLVEEIDDILNNPSDDDGDRPAPIIHSPVRARAGPGGSIALGNPLAVDL